MKNLRGELLVIKTKDICDLNQIKEILDSIRVFIVEYEDQIGEVTVNDLENVDFQLCEIEKFIIGTQKWDKINLANKDSRMMIYWRYIDEKCSFSEMIGELKQNEGEI